MKPVTRSHIFLSLFFCLCIIFLACKKNNISAPVLSANKVITSFNLNQADNAGYLSVDVIGSVGTDTIILTIPLETDRTNLKPNITFTGKSINPSSAVAQNFSSPLIYTVTAEDGSTKKYTVLVTYRSTVYFCTHYGSMYALDAMTGQQIWKLTNGNFHSGTPSVYNGMVYICGIDGLYALDQKTGIQKWKYPITALYAFSEFTPSTVVANNTVYICAWDGFVYALNATDGSLKWKTQSSGGAPFYSSVTLNNNLLYAGCSDSWLYALNISNGSVNWKFQTGDVIYKNPLVVNNNVFTSGLNGNQYMLNGATGAVIWSILNDLSICSPTFSNGVIYSGDGTNANGYDINTGNKVWSLGSGTGSGWSSPCVLNGKFYAGSSTPKFYAYDINSKAVIWSISTNAYNVNSSPVIANDIYYIGGNGQDFYAVDAATGTIKWFLPLSNPVYGSPCVIDQNGIKNYPGVSGEKN